MADALVARLLERVRSGEVTTKEQLHRAKMDLCAELGVATLPPDAALLAALPLTERARFRPLLAKKPTRTASGVAVVTVQSSPHACPHGTCTYCPGGPGMGTAQAYTGQEPAARRAARHGFDPYRQVGARIAQLVETGHTVDKVDLIVQGGTFPARDLDYQQWFLKRCYDAMNDGPEATHALLLGGDDAAAEAGAGERREAPERPVPSRNRFGLPGALTLDEAKARNESAPSRCIGLTLETRPDWCLEPHLDAMLDLGATRVEIGVQTLNDEVHRATRRFQTREQVREATRAAKDAGFKVCYHMMPGLPGTTPEEDLRDLRALFDDEPYRPDMLKIYPTLVIANTDLYRDWLRGSYEPLSTEEAARVVGEAKAHLPSWVRVQRVERDIPTPMIQHGVESTNLRQLAKRHLRRAYGRDCACVRCREVGHRLVERAHDPESLAAEPQPDRVALKVTSYDASSGPERFLALEDPGGTLYGYLRLRVLERSWRPELGREPCTMVRELKVPGAVVPLGARGGASQFQHRGLGRDLVAEAARVTRDDLGLRSMFVIAGVGVKPYYRKLGFVDDGPYLRLDVPRGVASEASWEAPPTEGD